MLSRRTFLNTSSLIALVPSVPAFLARTARAIEPGRDRRVLVVVQLDGGNDGINTVVPLRDEGYTRYRRELRLPAERIIRLTDEVGLHPAMGDAARLWESGRLAIVQGVGYPNPNRSHEVSMATWHTARFDQEEQQGLGWIGRALDEAPTRGGLSALFVGRESPPAALRARRAAAAAIADLSDYAVADAGGCREERQAPGRPEAADDLAAFIRRSTVDAYTTAERLGAIVRANSGAAGYPSSGLAGRLRLAASLIKAGLETRVYYMVQPGYDTHYRQLPTQEALLGELSGALRAFVDDLAGAGLADRVAVLAFSEFGRRVEENASLGTDHGTAGVVFLAGGGVRGGLVGSMPSLLDLEDGDLKVGIDFRQVYAAVLADWLGLDSADPLGGSFESVPIFRL